MKVFVDLYDEGLIYRGQRLVNWDPTLNTALSDLEVESIEENMSSKKTEASCKSEVYLLKIGVLDYEKLVEEFQINKKVKELMSKTALLKVLKKR